MLLSQAIRKGAEQHPQYFSEFIKFDTCFDDTRIKTGEPYIISYEIIATCALGAAYIGKFGSSNEYLSSHKIINTLCEEYAVLNQQISKCPVSYNDPFCQWNTDSGDLTFLIIHLNDNHKWTREKIADYVASIERCDT